MSRLLLLPLLAVSGIATAQTLTIDGACPGRVDITVSGLTPGGDAAILVGLAGLGADILPGGPCRGTLTDVAGVRLQKRVRVGPEGRIEVSPVLSEDTCGTPVQVIDLFTCDLTNTAEIGGDGGGPVDNPECSDHVVLDDAYRNIDWVYDYNRCDNDLVDGGWYRFSGAAGDRMPEVAPPEYSCGTHAPGWLNGAHPPEPGETRTVASCNHWVGDVCWQSMDIQVTNCGDFHVYQLGPPPCCSCVFCGED